MAKEVYKIPYTVDNIRFRALVSFKAGNIGPKNQIYIYQIIGWLVIFVAVGVVGWYTPIRFSPMWIVPIALCGFILGFLGLKTQKNGLPGYRWIKPTFNYMIAKSDRKFTHLDARNGGVSLMKDKKGTVSIRFSPELQKLRAISDIEAISGEGVISYDNGDYGVIHRVSGFTSLVIMDYEMRQVIDSINKWFNSLDPTSSLTIITDHSNQRVVNQQNSLKELAGAWNERGDTPTPIAELIRSRYKELSAVRRRFKSSQQYLMVRSSSLDILDKELQQLQSSARQGMVKTVEPLTDKDTIIVLRDIMYGETINEIKS